MTLRSVPKSSTPFLSVDADSCNVYQVFYSRQTIGSTESLLGIFVIIRVTRLLATWASDTYWPWYRTHILCLTASASRQM